MIGHKMATAFLTVLPLADFCLLEHGNMLRTRGDPHGVRLPKSESIDRATRPGSARSAMAISHYFRLAGNLNMNSSAKTLAFVSCRHCRFLPRFNIDTPISRGDRASWPRV
jgi:hypothetical protein